MYCRYCGEEIDDNEVYCPNCGELVWEPALDEAHAAGVRKSSGRKHRAVAIIVVVAILALAVGSCGIVLFSQFNIGNGEYAVQVNSVDEIYVDLGNFDDSANLTHSSSEEIYSPTYQWNYNGIWFSLPLQLSKEKYEYFQGLGHMTNNLTKYATDSYNREIAADIAEKMIAGADYLGFNSYDRLMLAASFVQNLQYQTDKESKGVDEYARYPIETLVDGVADCEDSAVLLASILKEMGYEVIIIKFEGHVAVGIAFNDYSLSGASFMKDGVKYYYLETVSPGWDIGEIPDKYLGLPLTVFPVN